MQNLHNQQGEKNYVVDSFNQMPFGPGFKSEGQQMPNSSTTKKPTTTLDSVDGPKTTIFAVIGGIFGFIFLLALAIAVYKACSGKPNMMNRATRASNKAVPKRAPASKRAAECEEEPAHPTKAPEKRPMPVRQEKVGAAPELSRQSVFAGERICSVCYGVLTGPAPSLPCGHSFHFACLSDQNASGYELCPVCPSADSHRV